ncbi:hypothetical protein SUGI_0693280 [Cryptomeria japonica]|uniref:putative UPF0481 protein At3g02645 n=1 Tax=Cryptomeria japonica TaxID=3369 RepID=UPI002414C676|nr:putative UPF0481 protein At3g02645 [Cryptomeria japonica]GLJ34469.1 hypothetical protein SUGI_0693280 [Cryptomeria japonica]
MDQLNIPTYSSNNVNHEIDSGELNDGGRNASVESWLIQVKRPSSFPHRMWEVSEKVCIYRVPKHIMISNVEAYIPLVVSFGPYHHKISAELSTMDQYKLQAVHIVLERLKIDAVSLIAEIHKLETQIRECYEEPIDMNGEALSWMMVMDACFILHFFSGENSTNRYNFAFPSLGYGNVMSRDILNDIMKLENQIPLFVLLKILQMEFGTIEAAEDKLCKILSKCGVSLEHPFFPVSSSSGIETWEILMDHILRSPHHLLDLCRMVIKDRIINYICIERRQRRWSINTVLPRFMQGHRSIDIVRRPYQEAYNPSAESLHKAAIKFQPGQLRFEKRRFGTTTLSLPQIDVDVRTEARLRNLMAYEECQICSRQPESTVISNFVLLLQDLINSEKDVSLLRKFLIIRSWVGSDEDIVRMFNRLGAEITFIPIKQFEVVMKEARDHYNSRWRVWWSQLKQDIFAEPWYILSLLTAIFILVMTAAQTAMTAIQTMYTLKK